MVGQHWVTDIFLLLAPRGEEMCLDKKHEEGLEARCLESLPPLLSKQCILITTLMLFIYSLVMDRTAAFPVVRISNKK